jgi:hypothetical protein
MLVSQRMPLTAPSNVDRPRPVRNQSSLYLLAVPGAATAYLYHSIHVGLERKGVGARLPQRPTER